MTTQEIIEPLITKTYGDGETAQRLAEHLAKRIDEYDDEANHGRGREHMVTQYCWMWYAGGSTAAHLAKQIERALNA